MPITVIQALENVVLSTNEQSAIIGAGMKKKVKKTENKFVEVAGFSPRIVREVKLSKPENGSAANKPGDKISVGIFSTGDIVKVTGTTKGRGFAGAVKRWGFAGGPKTHGQSDRHRAPGSIGQKTTPGRVYKGKRMAGHMGNVKKTVTGLTVVAVDQSKNQLFIKGSVPGPKNSFVVVEKTGAVKDPSLYQLFSEGEQTEPDSQVPPQVQKKDQEDEQKAKTATDNSAANLEPTPPEELKKGEEDAKTD